MNEIQVIKELLKTVEEAALGLLSVAKEVERQTSNIKTRMSILKSMVDSDASVFSKFPEQTEKEKNNRE